MHEMPNSINKFLVPIGVLWVFIFFVDQQSLRLRLAYLMHRFLLIALGIGFLLPTAVQATNYVEYESISSSYDKVANRLQAWDEPGSPKWNEVDKLLERIKKDVQKRGYYY